MTEASENAYLVRVRAQVMCRDEGTGGWVALGGGGLADVMVGKRSRPSIRTSACGDTNGDSASLSAGAPPHEYFIHGKRISDNMVVLECTIKKDFQYNKVMPTFHHWVTDEKRFGLTFQTAADARAFDRGVRTAIEELLDGLGGAWPSLHAYQKYNPAPTEDDEENNIFECLNLPSDSRSSSENSTVSRSRRRDELSQTPILSAITLPAHGEPMKQQFEIYDDKLDVESDCAYVHLSPVHEYTYPQMGSGSLRGDKTSPNTKPPLKRDSDSLRKKCGYCDSPPLPEKKQPEPTYPARVKCRHCQEWYLESANRLGACEYGPDCFRSCINAVSCIKCAQCMLYHCMSDSEGDFALHPCACANQDENSTKRWISVALLSLVVPCLCCYLPLRALHRAARALRLAGATHSPTPQHRRT